MLIKTKNCSEDMACNNFGQYHGMSICHLLHTHKSQIKLSLINYIQEVFHVYLNKFENAVTHLFLVIFSNN